MSIFVAVRAATLGVFRRFAPITTLRRMAAASTAGGLILGLSAPALVAAPAVWTQHNDNSRSGENTSETVLTPSTVNTTQFGKLWSASLDDQSYSQPLYVPGLNMSDGKVHNVVYVTTVNNSVYAFDADTGVLIWHVNLSPSGAIVPANTNMASLGACSGSYTDFTGKFGIVGTPVINTANNEIYLVARTIEGGSWIQRLHALNITSGADVSGSPVVISGSANGVSFSPTYNNQRPALTLLNGVVYIAWSSHCDFGPYHGFVMGYNASSLAQEYVWSDTGSGGSQGGIWMGGQGLTVDGSNNLYVMTGNGTWDGSSNFGESFVKLTAGLGVEDYFTPSTWSSLNGGDNDLGAAGALGIPGTSYVFGGGKTGIVYLVNTANMGHEGGTDNIVQEFQATFPPGGDTGHIHGGPIYFNTGSAQYVYLWGENDYLRAFQFNGSNFNSSAVATSTMKSPTSGVGMPGGFLASSSNGTSGGVIWALTPYNGDANHGTVSGILHAFNAIPSGGTLTELWNSQMNAGRDSYGNYAKFTYPTISNGKVYVATFGSASSGSGGLAAYGELGSTPEAPYGGTAAPIPGTLQAENYDTGGQSVAYNIGTNSGTANSYRSDGVDLEACTDTGGGYEIGWSAAGQWYRYTVNVATAGTYTATFRVANGSTANATLHLQNSSGTNLTGTVTVPVTGGWQTWVNVTATVTLPAGQQVLTVSQDSAGYNLNYVSFASSGGGTAPAAPTALTATAGNAQVGLSWIGSSGATSYNVYRGTTTGGESTTAIATGITTTTYTNTGLTNGTKYYFEVSALNSSGTSARSGEASATPAAGGSTEGPYLGTPWAIPGTVQAENYDTGGQGVGYSIGTNSGTANGYRTDGVDLETTTDTGAGYDVGWTAAAQWFRYTVNVATAGTYTVSLRVAADVAVTNGLHISNSSGTNLSGEVSLPSTGGWQTWETVTASVTLPAGQQVLTVNQDTGGWNFNYVTFASSGGTSVNGTWQLTPENSTGLRLDVAGNGTANGTLLNAYTSNGTGAQSFTFSNTGVAPAGDYNFTKTGGSYCVQPSGTASGSTVEIWACAGTAAQSWNVVTSPTSGYYELEPYTAGALCLNNTGTASGSSVTVATCNASTGQQWSGL